jgi:hypothetical protein
MGIPETHGRKAPWICLLAAALLGVGCAGIQPYDPYNHREEGPEKGLFTGSAGEFVIFRKAEAPETGAAADRRSVETAVDEQQKMDREEREDPKQ